MVRPDGCELFTSAADVREDISASQLAALIMGLKEGLMMGTRLLITALFGWTDVQQAAETPPDIIWRRLVLAPITSASSSEQKIKLSCQE